MRYTPNNESFHRKDAQIQTRLCTQLVVVQENGRYVQATQASASRAAIKNTSSPLQALRVRLGGGYPFTRARHIGWIPCSQICLARIGRGASPRYGH